jgi:hypothetical protein
MLFLYILWMLRLWLIEITERERINLDMQIINPPKCTDIIIYLYCSSIILQHIYSFEESNSMEQNPPWDANSSCTNQEIPRILQNPTSFLVQKVIQLVCVLSHKAVSHLPIPPLKFYFNIILFSMPRCSKCYIYIYIYIYIKNSSCCSVSGFPTDILYNCLFSCMCRAYPILLDFITWIYLVRTLLSLKLC